MKIFLVFLMLAATLAPLALGERTKKNMDRVLDIVNSELCFGVPATKCKCYTQNEVPGNFSSLRAFGECLPGQCTCEKFGYVNVLGFRLLNEFLCGFEVPDFFLCLGGKRMERPFKTLEDFGNCPTVAFSCPNTGGVVLSMADPFKGFYPEQAEEKDDEKKNEEIEISIL